MATETAPGWYNDPTNRHLYRYWDGAQWTGQVSDGGTSGVDPEDMDPALVTMPPAPGSAAPGAPPAAPAPTVQVTQGGGGFGMGAILGVLVGIVIIVLIVLVVASGGDDGGTTTTVADVTTTAAP